MRQSLLDVSMYREIRRMCTVGFALYLVLAPNARAQLAPEVKEARAAVRQAVEDTIQGTPYEGAFWGIEITNLQTGRRLFRHNSDHLFVPASNVKLLTTAAALRRLGPDYRYRTRVYADGQIQEGVLRGNLVVRGSGDPTLGGYQQRQDPLQIFRRWADSLQAAGIERITGDIVGDDGAFREVPFGEGWSWNDIPYSYAAESNGLVFNVNTIDMTVRGQRPNEPGRISWTPFNTEFVDVINETRTVRADSTSDEEYDRPMNSNTFTVSSRLHPGEIQEERLSVTDPTEYFVHVFREVLIRNGISVGGRSMDADRGPFRPNYNARDVRQVASYQSPPLRRVVRTMNHESQNLYAEQLLRTLAIVNRPDTTARDLRVGSAGLGVLAVKSELAAAGVDTSRVQLVDGSGLSRKNYVSPRAMTRLLEYVWVEADAELSTAFYESLPTGGRDGTLEYRFRDGERAEGEVRAKTGTLSSVSALSGYVSTAGGTPLSFVVFCNHHLADVSAVRSAQDVIVNQLAGLEF